MCRSSDCGGPAIGVGGQRHLRHHVTIGFLPVIFDCSRYTTADACGALTFASCRTRQRHRRARFPDALSADCSAFDSQGACRGALDGGTCVWQFNDNKCAHVAGWTANEQGMLAGIQIVGSMLATPLSGVLLSRVGRRWSLVVASAACAVGCVLFSAGWAAQASYGALLAAELFAGAASVTKSAFGGVRTHDVLRHKILSLDPWTISGTNAS